MQIYQGEIYITLEDWERVGYSAKSVKESISQLKPSYSSIQSIKDPADERGRLYLYSSLAEVHREKFERYFGGVEGFARAELQRYVVIREAERQAFGELLGWNYDRAKDYATASAWLRFLARMRVVGKGTTVKAEYLLPKEVYQSKKQVFSWACVGMQQMNVRCIKPKSGRYLEIKTLEYRKVEDDLEGVFGLLHSGRYGLKNALAKDSDVHRATIVAAYAGDAKYDKTYAHKLYAQVMRQKGLEPLSERWAMWYLEQEEARMLLAEKRHGKKAHKDLYAIHHHRKRPSPMAAWTGDGLYLGLLVKQKAYNRSGEEVWTTKKLVVWLWYDWFSEAVVGYRIGNSESGDMLRLSFRDGLNLWEGQCPGGVQIDRQWANNPEVKRMFERAAVKIKDKAPYNPQESIAERFNKEINKYMRRMVKGWSEGTHNWVNMTYKNINFTHKPETIKDYAPFSYEEALSFIHDLIHFYNNTPLEKYGHKSRVEYLQAHLTEAKSGRKIAALERAYLFSIPRLVELRKGWVKISIGKRKYWYQVKNFHTVASQTKDFKALAFFDEDHPEEIYLYDFDPANPADELKHKYLSTCARSEGYNPVSWEQSKEDKLEIAKQAAEAQKQQSAQEKRWEEIQRIIEEYGIETALQVATQQEIKEILHGGSVDYRSYYGSDTPVTLDISEQEEDATLDRKRKYIDEKFKRATGS
ncbi:MAG: hypothetical protein NW226_17680 [Microscillaceae bacterium]|nr:hypothetical protein [Microscillaceae bacterium]